MRLTNIFGSLRGYPSISYVWLNSLTFNPVTIILKKQQQQQKTNKKHRKKKNQKYIYTNIDNQSNI